jgi:hypothetical protein
MKRNKTGNSGLLTGDGIVWLIKLIKINLM